MNARLVPPVPGGLADMAAGGGSMVNTASQWGLQPAPGHIAYNTSKAAVVSFTQSLARDYAPHGIRVNAVCPGEIHTPMLAADCPVRTAPSPTLTARCRRAASANLRRWQRSSRSWRRTRRRSSAVRRSRSPAPRRWHEQYTPPVRAAETVLVTGGSRGIGAAVARALHRDGAFVVVHCGSNRQLADRLSLRLGERATAVCVDLLNRSGPTPCGRKHWPGGA